MKKNKILITGANGFVGNDLVNYLSKFHDIYPSGRGENVNGYKNYIKTNYQNENENEISNIKFNSIIHLGFSISRDNSLKSYVEQIESIKSTLFISNLAKKNKSKIIFPSTLLIYQKPYCFYSLTKTICEEFIRINNKDFLIFRIGVLYGKGQKNMFLPNIISNSINNKETVIFGGDQKRDFLHISDFCNLVKKSINCKINGIHDVGFGASHKINDIIKYIKDCVGKKLLLKYEHEIENENEFESSEIERTKIKFNWKPKIKIKTGVKKLIKEFI